MKTFLYIDGFNLYNRALIRTPYKWLNLKALAAKVLRPENEVARIRYYTARVSGRTDPDQPVRQGAYLRALATIPELSVHYGNFLSKTIRRPLVAPIAGLPRVVEVHSTEEKGSDVNLASHLVWDGAQGQYDVAVVLSKDTDLVEPIRIVRQEIGLVVGLICPDGQCPKALRDVASFVRHLDNNALAASQFPPVLASTSGHPITKPAVW